MKKKSFFFSFTLAFNVDFFFIKVAFLVFDLILFDSFAFNNEDFKIK